MEAKIKAALMFGSVIGVSVPAPVKALLIEVGAELDLLRAELDLVKSNQPKE